MKHGRVLLVLLLLGLGRAQTLSPAQALFDAAIELLRVNYYGYGNFDADAARRAFQPQLEAACRDQPSCQASRATPVISALTESLNDPHTYYLDSEATRARNLEGSGSGGLSAGLKLQAVPDAAALVVTRVLQGGAAELVGVRRGDLIWAVARQPLSAYPSAAAALAAIAGLEATGAPLELTLGRGKARLDVVIKPQPGAVWLPQLERRGDVGVITFFQFKTSGGVARRVHQLVNEARRQGISSLVLDLRDCQGGLITEMLGAVGAFVEHPVVLDEFQSGTVRFEFQNGHFLQTEPNTEPLDTPMIAEVARWTGPVTVLTNRAAKSAPEYLAFLLQRDIGATVIGEPTLGALNTSNGFFALPDNSSLAITLGRTRLEDGTPFPARVTPDVPVSDDLTDLAVGEDAPLELALRGAARPSGVR